MKDQRLLTTAILALVLLAGSVSAGQADRRLVHPRPAGHDGPRTALVIGNGAYAVSPLKNPSNDARDVAKHLEELGFDVTLGTDWTRRQMEDAIRAFGERLRGGGVGLFYYAGHGVQVDGRNYLIPVDAQIESESEVEFEAVDAGRVLGRMDDAGNGFNIVVLDACRNNPFARSFRDARQGLAQVTAPSGSFIAYATSPGSVAADGAGRNGTYTAALLEAVGQPGLKLEEVFKRVRQAVARTTGGKQVPWDSSSLVGEFYFAGDREANADPVPVGGRPDPTARPVTDTSVDLGNGVRIEVVYLAPGSFEMGSDRGNQDEKPAHRVTISRGFLLGKYEVTQGQWEAVMGTNPSKFKGKDDLPVENVSWEECQEFIRRLNSRTGKGWRLPTEAEWEYASRAGERGDNEGKLEELAWYKSNSGGSTQAVGRKRPNGWGLYDMHGNVWEWCSDWYEATYYSRSPASDPEGASVGTGRVLRGGAWNHPAANCRAAARGWNVPSFRFNNLGLRLARTSD